ncbi:hypothetical protein [Hymenobacter nivis]|uniref:DUF5723 domain-containing protein n=1 Tax=Hymenobacter nivis TaxID=1850093 RepID=A0A502GM77_9BACT|nr:hypothetical protein [Hymenobacter nivis]TPG62951.1 hypothetical protein EAH73_17970 [Hymenobacter nivis]
MPCHYSFCGRLLLGAGLLAGPALRAGAQTVPADTTRLQYSEELAIPPATDAPLRVQREERDLWKLGLNNFLPGARSLGDNNYYTRYGLHIAYERKLRRPAWSVLGEVSPAITHFRLGNAGDLRPALSVRAQVGARYYYNLERRLRQGHGTGNFSANYLSLAVGTGLGRNAHETPFYLFATPRGGVAAFDAALLYGLQRRLGRYGFVDANVGITGLASTSSGFGRVDLGGSLRLGIVLGAPPVVYSERLAPADEAVTLRPRFYAGVEVGGYFYRAQYSEQTPYPSSGPIVKTSPSEIQIIHYPTSYRDGYGTYSQYVAAGPVPYVYVGYYVAPRLAVQVGVQGGGTLNEEPPGTLFDNARGIYRIANQTLRERGVAVPVLVRYALTPAFLNRWQFDAIGGLVPVWSAVDFREYLVDNQIVTNKETFGFQRRTFGLHATVGYAASYGFGRRRRVQATAEAVLNKDVRTIFRDGREDLQGGASIGLRYRFGYR